jgi:quinol monooxygenase YgiN
MTDPIVVTAIFSPAAGREAELLSALETVIPLVHQEAGCLLYSIQRAPDGTIVMIEKLDAHGQGAPIGGMRVALDGLLAAPVTVTRLVPIPVGDAVKGAL